MVPRHLLQAVVCAVMILTLAATAEGQSGRHGEFRVNTYVNQGQMYPSVAMNPTGNSVVVWYSQVQDGGTCGVYGQRFDAEGSPAGGEFQVNTYTAGVQDWPTVAICDVGRFVVTWTSYDQDGSDAGIFAQIFAPDGTKMFNEIRVNTYTTDRQKYPVVAMDADGGFVVAWQSRYQDGSEDGIYAQRFDNHGQKLGSEFQVNNVTLGYQMLPAIAMDPDGDFVIVWLADTQEGMGAEIRMRRYASDGTPQGTETFVNTYHNDDQADPAVAMDANGNYVVTWGSWGQDGDNNGVYAQMFYANGTWRGNEFRVSTETALSQDVPTVAMQRGGDFVIFWQSDAQDGSQWGVFGQAYDQDGDAIDEEFQFNTYTTGMQMMPSAAIDQNGDYLVAWMSSDQDGSGQGIYADYGWLFDPGAVAQDDALPAGLALRCPTLVPPGAPARLSLALAAPAAVDLSVYDARGSLLRRLVREVLASGTHEIVWDGAGASGRPVPSGVYFVRTQAGRADASRRIVVLR
jgi:hypothetical protein